MKYFLYGRWAFEAEVSLIYCSPKCSLKYSLKSSLYGKCDFFSLQSCKIAVQEALVFS